MHFAKKGATRVFRASPKSEIVTAKQRLEFHPAPRPVPSGPGRFHSGDAMLKRKIGETLCGARTRRGTRCEMLPAPGRRPWPASINSAASSTTRSALHPGAAQGPPATEGDATGGPAARCPVACAKQGGPPRKTVAQYSCRMINEEDLHPTTCAHVRVPGQKKKPEPGSALSYWRCSWRASRDPGDLDGRAYRIRRPLLAFRAIGHRLNMAW